MSNATCFVRGSIHQGDSQFSNISRGRQCSFTSLSALLCANSCDILTWTSDIIDRILIEGDAMYLKAFEERSIPDEETLSLNYLPGRVLCTSWIGKDQLTDRDNRNYNSNNFVGQMLNDSYP